MIQRELLLSFLIRITYFGLLFHFGLTGTGLSVTVDGWTSGATDIEKSEKKVRK